MGNIYKGNGGERERCVQKPKKNMGNAKTKQARSQRLIKWPQYSGKHTLKTYIEKRTDRRWIWHRTNKWRDRKHFKVPGPNEITN